MGEVFHHCPINQREISCILAALCTEYEVNAREMTPGIRRDVFIEAGVKHMEAPGRELDRLMGNESRIAIMLCSAP